MRAPVDSSSQVTDPILTDSSHRRRAYRLPGERAVTATSYPDRLGATRMVKFKIPKAKTSKPASPEDLFATLKRSAKVPHLWAHQADILRAYNTKAKNEANVALELPTGAGKSLVGLLVAEFRRQALNERVAYLCPTKQLVQQVHQQADEYGIPTVVLVGKQRDWPAADYTAYNDAAKIAVTTYSAIFNTG